MEDKLCAIDDAMDFIKLAVNEINEYPELSDLIFNLKDIRSELMDFYRETEDKIKDQEDIDLEMKLAYEEGKL